MSGDAVGAVQRHDYTGDGLTEEMLAATPYGQMRRWVDEADERALTNPDVYEPRALSVATVDARGVPNVRTVLMRFLDERGPGFVSSADSAKGLELAANAHVAVSLTWPAMFRAIRLRGRVEAIAADEVHDYWVTRPWGSRIGAWASHQSAPARDRARLEEDYARYAAQFPDRGRPDDVPVPESWAGYRVRADEVEFWAGRSNRLHDRLVFTAVGAGGGAAAQDVSVWPSLDDSAAWVLTRRQP
ncbi:MAG: pyridoxamine 5'-phosphate oxidase [Actinomycetota bacterium]|nr:pyridoxamine 5'-phosphate oxidase [Actinomycetota bacterium]